MQQTALEPTPTVETATPTPSLMDLEPVIWMAWKGGAHGAGYDLGKGPNTYCAQCHSPLDWDPQAKIDTPPNCVSCKFPSDTQVRIAAGNPLIAEADWHGIECAVCHRLKDGEKADASLHWYDAASGTYETVANSTQLCGKCHRDTDNLHYAVSLGNNIHADFTCTQCHDPHKLVASCTQSGCHTGLVGAAQESPHASGAVVTTCSSTGCHESQSMVGRATPDVSSGAWDHRDQTHGQVSCEACHDAAGMEVGPLEDTGQWVTLRKVTLLNQTSDEPFPSHDLQREVDCTRCHYPDNPWGLLESVRWK